MAAALYPAAAMFNHRCYRDRTLSNRRYPILTRVSRSCEPSAVQSFLGSSLQLRALVDIRAGDEVTISYIDCIDTNAQRRHKLQVNFPRACQDEGCAQNSALALRSSTTVSPAGALAARRQPRQHRPGVLSAPHAAIQSTALWSSEMLLQGMKPSSNPMLKLTLSCRQSARNAFAIACLAVARNRSTCAL